LLACGLSRKRRYLLLCGSFDRNADPRTYRKFEVAYRLNVMAEFKDRLPKQFGSLSDNTVMKGEAMMPAIQRRQYEKALRDAEKRVVTLRQKAEKTEGWLARSRLEETATQAENAAAEMRRKIAELDAR
jgi:hypothetical protein